MPDLDCGSKDSGYSHNQYCIQVRLNINLSRNIAYWNTSAAFTMNPNQNTLRVSNSISNSKCLSKYAVYLIRNLPTFRIVERHSSQLRKALTADFSNGGGNSSSIWEYYQTSERSRLRSLTTDEIPLTW